MVLNKTTKFHDPNIYYFCTAQLWNSPESNPTMFVQTPVDKTVEFHITIFRGFQSTIRKREKTASAAKKCSTYSSDGKVVLKSAN